MFPSCASRFTMAVAHALFSGVSLSTDAAHEYTIELAAKQPEQYRNAAKYRAGTLSVATEMMKPTMAVSMGTEMCQPRSLLRSLEYATAKETIAPTRYGGAVRARVVVVEPRWKPCMMLGFVR